MQTYEIVSLIVIGFFLGKLDTGTFSKLRKYFGSPVDERIEFGWGMRQLFRIFSTIASERFYDSSALCYQSAFVSILCGLGFIDIVRYEYATDHDDRVVQKVKYYHGFRSYKSLLKMAKDNIQFVQKETNGATGFYQLFICGHNIVSDYWSGE